MKKNQIVVLENGNGLVTKAFAKQARIFGTPEYKMWREFLADNKDAEMEIRTIKKNTNKDTYRKNMTYDNMCRYISTLPESERISEEFNKIVIKSKLQVCPYDYVAGWFKATFPNYKTHEMFAVVEKEESKSEPNKIAG